MQAFVGTQPTLIGTVWPTGANSVIRAAVLMVVGTVLLWLSAKIQVPLYPVPITMQTLVVLTLGVAYGWKLGGATMLLYLAEGAIGLPVFAGGWGEGGGVQHLYGPTAGYLIGFVVAGAACGWLAERGWDRGPILAGAAMVLGNLIIYALGVTWLAGQIGWMSALQFGLLPFLVGDALKIVLGASLLPLAWKALGHRQGSDIGGNR